jgi:anti-sigma regulatory factor (Ser/Thr protein kinase)
MEPVLVVESSECDARDVHHGVAQAGFVSRSASTIDDVRQFRAQDHSAILIGNLPPGFEFQSLKSLLQEWYPQIPVVTITDVPGISPKDALQAEVAGCLPKGSVAIDLGWTLQTILAQTPSKPDNAAWGFTIDNQPELLPLIVAQVRKQMDQWSFEDPIEPVRVIVALSEALDNALYHGNLELSSELRQGDGRAWREESQRRRLSPPYCDRRIRFQGVFTDQLAQFTIRDEGPGFDPSCQGDCTESQNLERCSGRGLLLMQMYLDQVTFNRAGNEVTLVKNRPLASRDAGIARS